MTDLGSPSLVSVVMIFRDALAFLDDAVRSVLSQTHPVELLVCDDGSTDGSSDVARGWAAEEASRIRYLEHPAHGHRGMSATRNLGLRAARGEFVAFLDADDVWTPTHVAEQMALLVRHAEADLVCGQALLWSSWREGGDSDVWVPPPWPHGALVPPPRMLAATLRRGAYRTPTCSLLVKRALLEQVAGAEESFTAMFEDQALLAKLQTVATTVISGSRTALYRQHPGSASAQAKRQGSYDPLAPNRSKERYLRWLESYLTSHAAGTDPELRNALESALMPYQSGVSLRPPLRSRIRSAVPPRVVRRLRAAADRARSLGPVRMGSLRRLKPLSREFGYDRGLPVDRYYIEAFLQGNAHVIAGRVLEVGDSTYTRRFGGERVTRFDVLNISAGDPETTFVADLAQGGDLPSRAFDCVVLTQTLHLVYDLPAAVRTLHRILAPGGTLLATFPGISPLSADRWAASWYWALTPVSAQRLFGEEFGTDNIEVTAHGNVLTSVAFLEGMAAEELRPRELMVADPQFPMLITVRAGRPVTDDQTPPG